MLFIIQDISEPVKYIYTITGVASAVILFFSVNISMIKRRINLMKYRKTIGLYGFCYAFLHFINFAVFDASLDFIFIFEETLDKPFIYLGMIAFFILLFMAITSTKRLFKKYVKYHKVIYVALVLITIHFVMAQKVVTMDIYFYLTLVFIIAYYKLQQLIHVQTK